MSDSAGCGPPRVVRRRHLREPEGCDSLIALDLLPLVQQPLLRRFDARGSAQQLLEVLYSRRLVALQRVLLLALHKIRNAYRPFSISQPSARPVLLSRHGQASNRGRAPVLPHPSQQSSAGLLTPALPTNTTTIVKLCSMC